jgi:hypothetical protein
MEILELPQERPPVNRRFDFQGLSDVLFESADLLEDARTSEDPEFRAAAIDLAIRSLYTASAAIDRYVKKDAPENAATAPGRMARPRSAVEATATAPAAVLTGPWALATR